MRIKHGVQFERVHLYLWYAAQFYDFARQYAGLGEATVTGGTEGPDAGEATAARVAGTDLHAAGRAIDLRTNDLPGGPTGATAQALARWLQQALDWIGPHLKVSYRVVIEVDHLHVEARFGGLTV